jgi:putative intracellular protease/amidase
MKLACLLSNGFEDMEAVGTVAILRRSGIDGDYVSVDHQQEQTGYYKTTVKTEVMLSDVAVERYDGLFIPGGAQSSKLRVNQAVLDLVMTFHRHQKWLFAICAGPTVLGVLGLLEHKEYTAFPNTDCYMKKGIRIPAPVVQSQNIITGAAAGAVYEFAFKIIEVLQGSETAKTVKERILYRQFE